MTEKPQDDTIKSRIMALLQKGYNRGQLINDFSFAERTVDSAIKDYKEQGGAEADEPKKSDDLDSKALSLPAKLDIRQVIAPEYLIKHLSFVDGGQRQTFIDALLVYEAARRSLLEKEKRSEQHWAMSRPRKTGMTIITCNRRKPTVKTLVSGKSTGRNSAAW